MSPRRALMTLLVAAQLFGVADPTEAQHLAVRTFTAADGLAGDYVQCLTQDRRGLLWIGTNSGLSRFDGRRFVTYSLDDGLPHPNVTEIVEDHNGVLWIGTPSGLVWTADRRDCSGRLFVPARCKGEPVTDPVLQAIRDADGEVWAVTGKAILHVDESGDACPVAVLHDLLPHPELNESAVEAIAFAPDRSVWLGTSHGLVRLLPDGRRAHYPVEAACRGSGRDTATCHVAQLLVDHRGKIWAGTDHGAWVLEPEPTSEARGHTLAPEAPALELGARASVGSGPGSTRHRPLRPPRALLLPTDGWVLDLETGHDGTVFAATVGGLIAVGSGAASLGTGDGDRIDGEPMVVLDEARGLVDHRMTAVLEDRDGLLWIGTQGSGLMRLDRSGMTSWGPAEGLGTDKASSILRGPEGRVVVVGYPPCTSLYALDGGRFDEVRIPTPGWLRELGWGWSQVTFMDSRGEWWVPTEQGLLRFGRVERLEQLAHARPSRIYRAADGLGSDRVFRTWESSTGDLWIGLFSRPGGTRMARWARGQDTFGRLGPADGIPFDTPTVFREAEDGTIWIGFYQGGVAAYHDGTFTFHPPAAAHSQTPRSNEPGVRASTVDGPPPGFVNDLLIDHHDRLWVATSRGLGRCDAPAAGTGALTWSSSTWSSSTWSSSTWSSSTWSSSIRGDGLGSVTALAEDGLGRILAGTYNGVVLLDPETGPVARLDTSAGLANNHVVATMRDDDGTVWLATARGVSHWRPQPEEPPIPPVIQIDTLQVDGRDMPLPELGVRHLEPIRLGAGAHTVTAGFAAVELRPGHRIRFSSSVDDGPWSEPRPEPQVRLVGIGPGTVRLMVRAVTSGIEGPPAELVLMVPPPLWQRWWFVATVAALLSAAGLLMHQARVRRLTALHEMRSRIAADLHDELGLSLTRISILAEVTRHQTHTASTGAATQGPDANATSFASADAALAEIGSSARELVDATGDMVWALDPARDDLGSLIARLRRLGSDVLEAEGVRFEVDADGSLQRITISSERRRHLLLILKEAIHNAARHAAASRVDVELRSVNGALIATVTDDGRGFEPASPAVAARGRGLASMARRADAIGAQLAVHSGPGQGCRVELRVR